MSTGDNLLEENMMTEPTIPQELLKKYILYAKRNVQPKLSDTDNKKISSFYAELRKEASFVGGLPIGVRHIESIIRMAESHARMHLRHDVRPVDVDMAIEMMLKSFLMSQKFAVAKALEKKFNTYLYRKPTEVLLEVLKKITTEKQKYLNVVRDGSDRMAISITKAEFEHEAKSYNVENVGEFYESNDFKRFYHIENCFIKPNN